MADIIRQAKRASGLQAKRASVGGLRPVSTFEGESSENLVDLSPSDSWSGHRDHHGHQLEAKSEFPDDNENENPRGKMSAGVWISVLISILSSHFLYALDNTVVADIQPSIIEDLGQISKLPWISVAFVFSAACLTLVWGRMYSQFNAKVVFISAVFIFEVGTAVCGAAPTMNALIVGRTLCGVGAGGIYTGTMFLVSALTTLKERPAYLGLTGITWGLGTILGPIIGGAFATSKATWRWGFYIGLPIGGLAFPVYIMLLPSLDLRPGVPLKQRLAEFDFLGSTLEVGAFVTGTMAISFGGAIYPWEDPRIVSLFFLSGMLWIGFCFQQGLCLVTNARNRLFPCEMLYSWDMIILFIEASASVTCVFVPIYFIPLYFEFVRGDGASHAAVRCLPFIFAFVVATILNGVLMAKTGYYKVWYLGGASLALAGSALMYTVDRSTSAGAIYGYSVLIAFGVGSFNQGCWAVAQAKSDAASFPLASALVGFANVLGLTLALSISNSVFINKATDMIAHTLPDVPRASVQAFIAGARTTVLEGLTADQTARVLDDISEAISAVYILTTVGAAVCVLFALFMKNEKLFV